VQSGHRVGTELGEDDGLTESLPEVIEFLFEVGQPLLQLAALEQLMVHFSQLVVEQRWIKEIDVNPLLVSPEQLITLDARVLLYGPDTEELKPALPKKSSKA
jgi:succinyl-CoA synthetase beta subunit